MKKKLPGVFPGKVKKDSGNNKRVFYSSKAKNSINNKNVEPVLKLEKDIKQKINEIFNSPNYIYKADVEIRFNDKIVVKRIVGRNNTHLITMENELIPINDVIDIKTILSDIIQKGKSINNIDYIFSYY